ncbi:serine hydrolase [Parasphingopyxis algicola]|uniref:serine hydrolase domain-containing protein n=1 Tax=Parasphingopyxis algicola TaxID=2026624 RepID=UPI0015A3D8B1|nr:serine hydrolase [Parasphingopyxis algicola]QLC25746.1 serine hydrolase [Parasphingopyxis algicola]
MIRTALLVAAALLAGSPTAACADDAPPITDTLDLAAMSAAIDGGEYRRIEAIVVDRGGAILFEDYYRESGPESRIDARSAGKSITALAVGMAIADGALAGVDLPLLSFFAAEEPIAHDGAAKRAITLHDALTMSSALDCNDWIGESPGNEERMYDSGDWTRFALDIPLDAEYRRHAVSGQGRFSYCTAGAFLLGRVVERSVGEPFEAYVQRRLFDPLGIVDPEWTRAPEGVVQTGGQLSLRARDFAALGRLVLDGGEHDGSQLVPRDWIRGLYRPRVRATPDQSYGYLWWFANFRAPGAERDYSALMMSGNGGNKVAVFPELDAVVTILSTNYNRRDMHRQTAALIERYILPALVARFGEVEPAR